MRLWRVVVLVGLALTALAGPVLADPLKIAVNQTDRTLYKSRFALLIGASNYGPAWPSLPEIKGELESLRTELVAEGFDAVDVLPDPKSGDLLPAIQTFIATHGAKDAALMIVYAGHGWLDKDAASGEQGYLVPVDAPSPSESRAAFLSKAMSMSLLRSLVGASDAMHTLVVLDSCYSGSVFLQRGAPEKPKRLDLSVTQFEQMKAPGVQFLTAGAHNQRVPAVSKFMRYLTTALRDGTADLNADGFVTAKEIGFWFSQSVDISPQIPLLSDLGDLRLGDFVFQPSSKPKAGPPPDVQRAGEASRDEINADAAAWDACCSSPDADAADFEDYLKLAEARKVAGAFSTIAGERIAALQAARVQLLGELEEHKSSEKGSIYVYDMTKQVVLSDVKGNETRFPASLTKLMSMYIVFEEIRAGRLSYREQIPISEYAASRPPTKIGLREGEAIGLQDAIGLIVTRSANDLMVAVAERISGSEANFVVRMNATAARLGMASTLYTNSTGLPDAKQVTTARDEMKLGMALISDYPEFYGYFGMRDYTWKERTYENQNALLGGQLRIDGLRTGFTTAAGFNMILSAQRGGRRLIAVVMGAKSGKSRDQIAEEVLEAGFRKVESGSRDPLSTPPG